MTTDLFSRNRKKRTNFLDKYRDLELQARNEVEFQPIEKPEIPPVSERVTPKRTPELARNAEKELLGKLLRNKPKDTSSLYWGMDIQDFESFRLSEQEKQELLGSEDNYKTVQNRIYIDNVKKPVLSMESPAMEEFNRRALATFNPVLFNVAGVEIRPSEVAGVLLLAYGGWEALTKIGQPLFNRAVATQEVENLLKARGIDAAKSKVDSFINLIQRQFKTKDAIRGFLQFGEAGGGKLVPQKGQPPAIPQKPLEVPKIIPEVAGPAGAEAITAGRMELAKQEPELPRAPENIKEYMTTAPQLKSEGLEPVAGGGSPPEPPIETPVAEQAPPPPSPPAPPTAPPKEPPELTPIQPSRVSVVGEFPPTTDVLRYFRVPTRGKTIARMPVIKQVMSVIDPKLLVDNPIKQAMVLQGKLKDMSEAFEGVALSGVSNIVMKKGKPKSKNGLVVDNRVKPLENAPTGTDGKPSMRLHDIVEYADRYDMPPKLRSYFTEIRQVSREITAMLEKELTKYDITLRKLQGEADWVYLRRVVDKIGDIEAYGRSRWKGTQKPRSYETVEAGATAKKPVTYLDPELELKYQLQSAYNWITDLRVKELISTMTTTAKARVEVKYIENLIESKARKVAIDKLFGSYNYPSVISRASRGEVIHPSTMAQIRKEFPNIADRLSQLIESKAKPSEFTKLKEEFQEIADITRHEHELAKRKYKAALDRAGPSVDEGWGIYLPGKIFTTQELAGKKVLGRDIMREVEKQFGYNRPGTSSKVLSVAGTSGSIFRQTKASIDLSVQGIQTLGALGLDTMNLIKMPLRFAAGIPAKPTASWIKGALRGWQRVLDPIGALAWQNLPEIKQIQIEMIQHGANISRSEFAEATGILSKIPLFGNIYRWFGNAFTFGRNASQTYLYIGERQRALYGIKDEEQIEKRLDELAEWSNLATGGLSTRAMGISREQQAMENVLFFSTRLNRSIFGNLLHMGEGNYTGHMARDSVAGLIAAAVAFITGVSLLLGQKPRLNPLPERMGGDGAKFLTVKIGDNYIGIGSTYYTLVRLFSNIYATTQDNPADLFKISMDNPIARFIRSKYGPPMSLLTDFVTGHDYLGELTRDNLTTVAKTLGDWAIPIWVENILPKDEEGLSSWDMAAGGAEFFGGRSVPESDWDRVKILREVYSEKDYGKVFEDLNEGEIETLYANHTDLAELQEKQVAHWREIGDELDRTYDELRNHATEIRNNGLVNAAQALIDGRISKYDYDGERSYIRPYYSGFKSALWEMREGLDPEGVKEMQRHYAESTNPDDIAVDEYWEHYSTIIEKSELPKDWDSIEAEMIDFLMRYPQSTQDYIMERRYAWINELPEPARTVELERIEGIEDETWWDNYRDKKTEIVLKKEAPETGNIFKKESTGDLFKKERITNESPFSKQRITK